MQQLGSQARAPAYGWRRRALEQAASEGSPSDAAWVMRRAFDSILGGCAAPRDMKCIDDRLIG